jgi:uncharacterized protein (DUF1697 family)
VARSSTTRYLKPVHTWVILLRGINVGGNNPVPMKALRMHLEAAGFEDVQTYIQSGNVVLGSASSDAAEVSARVADIIQEQYGHRPAVLALAASDLIEARDRNPFPEADQEPRSVHLHFLASPPEKPDLDGLEAARAESERFHLDGRVFYLFAPDGIGRSKLAAKAERLLGVAATARNWRTVCRLCDMVGADAQSSS